MYRALYDYKTDIKGYLTFQTGDQFTTLNKSKKDWFLAQNGFGEIGYIPANYVVKDEVSESEVLKSIDRAIEMIHYEASSTGGQYSHTHRENLNKLIQHRKTVIDSYRNPEPSNSQASCHDVNSFTSVANGEQETKPRTRSLRRAAPEPPTRTSSEPEKSTNHVIPSLQSRTANTQKTNAVKVDTEFSASSPSQNNARTIEEKHITKTIPESSNQTIPNCVNTIHLEKQSIDTIDCATSPIHPPLLQASSDTDQISKNQSNPFDTSTIPISSNLGSELVEEVRRNTGMSYKNSGIAVETVLGHLGLRIPEISNLLDKVYKTFHGAEDEQTGETETSADYERLCVLFTELTACKDDSQQRGWALHEDETVISSNLQELVSILENAKKSICRNALAKDNYEFIYNLVQYYQMETRLKLRLLLLSVFGAMCHLDKGVITCLLCSILTTELADELQSKVEDTQRVSYVSLVLTMIFSTGEPVPANLNEHLNTDFLQFVFETMDDPPTAEHEDQVIDLLVNFILAYNLHFTTLSDNLVMKVIGQKGTVKVFTEKLLLLFNREDDPVRMFDHEPQPPNSVMKLLHDMYSSPSTSCILYTNDAKVLIDIILRNLVDRSPGDKIRSAHLKLIQLYLQNSDYSEHKHRFEELYNCLNRIQHEEEYTGDDKHIVTYIFTQLPLFTQA